jgi:hypothetical protein
VNKHYKGSCLCGGVKFEAIGFSSQVANCHCTMCRKFHGAAFATLVSVSEITWLSGNELLKDFIGHNGTARTFCSGCGSSIGFRLKGAPLSEIEIAISTFDEAIPVKVDAHIFTSYKANWCKINDELASFKEGRSN